MDSAPGPVGPRLHAGVVGSSLWPDVGGSVGLARSRARARIGARGFPSTLVPLLSLDDNLIDDPVLILRLLHCVCVYRLYKRGDTGTLCGGMRSTNNLAARAADPIGSRN